MTPSPSTAKPKFDWLGALSACLGGLGVCCLLFGLWRSCSAKEAWMARQMSYEDYQATDSSMLELVLLGLFLLAIGRLLRRQTSAQREEQSRREESRRRELQRSQEFDRKVRENPHRCPNCSSEDFDTHYPTKPQLLTPVTFSGILLGAAANSMSDAMFKPERICTHCGCRWPAP
jgi:hypothetical protein